LQENLGGTGSISTTEAEEYLREHMKLEGELERQREEKKKMQIDAVKEKLEQRKKERMRKLKEKQELERAQVRLLIVT
jgi:polyhydroxyalkanoate synthesis regulator phasin